MPIGEPRAQLCVPGQRLAVRSCVAPSHGEGVPLGVRIKGDFSLPTPHSGKKVCVFLKQSCITFIFRKIIVSFWGTNHRYKNCSIDKPYASAFGGRGRQPSTLSARNRSHKRLTSSLSCRAAPLSILPGGRLGVPASEFKLDGNGCLA